MGYNLPTTPMKVDPRAANEREKPFWTEPVSAAGMAVMALVADLENVAVLVVDCAAIFLSAVLVKVADCGRATAGNRCSKVFVTVAAGRDETALMDFSPILAKLAVDAG